MEVYSNSRHRRIPIWSCETWRLASRSKTVAAGILMCLHIGVDPPDTVKPNACAKLEAWIDPTAVAPAKALESIGRNVQSQYEFWQPRARYRLGLDPTLDEAKKIIASLRKGAKDERVLLHYNGHGVPRPTQNGELWVFNKQFTQYIPLSILDIHAWLLSPAIYVFDAPCAANLVNALIKHLAKDDGEIDQEVFMIAAASMNETLPISPDMPADILTCCLTTPIEIALKWYLKQCSVLRKLPVDVAMKIPGKLNERKTPLGELNWIFTAITDTIAWQILPRDLFKKLYRQDLLVASLFRNFLLAERILKSYGVNAITIPALPEAFKHPLWDSWDLAVDFCLGQIQDLLNGKEYQSSDFFASHLSSFQVWLLKGESEVTPPMQLPIVLQILLSQNHRLHALLLIGEFLDIGEWAVVEALNVGMFPYALKLLQSPSSELRYILLYIWVRILICDDFAQSDLFKDDSYVYFLNIFLNKKMSDGGSYTEEETIMSILVLAFLVCEFPNAQSALMKHEVLKTCFNYLDFTNFRIRQWSLLLIANLVRNNSDYKWIVIRNYGIEKLNLSLKDVVPEVRAAAVYCFSSFFEGSSLGFTEEAMNVEQTMIIRLLEKACDGSHLVRQELTLCLCHFVMQNLNKFLMTSFELWEEERQASKRRTDRKLTTTLTLYVCVWKSLLNLSVDPVPDVSNLAMQIVDDVNSKFLYSNTSGLKTGKVKPAFPEARRMTAPHINFLNESEKISLKTISEFENYSERSVPLPSTSRSSLKSPSTQYIATPSSEMPEKHQLNSQYLKWAAISLTADQKKKKKGENDLNPAQLWREAQKEKFSVEIAQWEKNMGDKRLDDQIAVMDNGPDSASITLFHPFDPVLIVSDEKSIIRVWNYEKGLSTNSFKNFNPKGTKITSLKYANVETNPLLLAGSNDGIVRIWKGFTSVDINFVTGWKASDVSPHVDGAGLKIEWQQWSSKLFVGGDSSFIKVWDVEREASVQELPCGSFSLSEITSDSQLSSLVFCGMTDGTIKIYDCRLPSNRSCIKTFSEHESYIVNIHKRTNGNLISGSVLGDIKIWDIRLIESIKTMDVLMASGMSALAIHPKVDLFAAYVATNPH